MISKVAADQSKSWHKHLEFILWALREGSNSTLGVPPFLLVYGRLPRVPLAILKDTMTGKTELPLNLGQLHQHQGHLSDCNFMTRLLYKNSY